MVVTIAQLFPWYTATDDEGNTYTVNDFVAAFTIPGYVFILLVSMQCIRLYVLVADRSLQLYGTPQKFRYPVFSGK